MNIDVDALAQEIRRVDGSNSLGAGALAEALVPFFSRTPANPTPPGWPDPLESPQAEAIRNGKVDDTEIRNLFDCMERELRLHRERAANPAQVTDAVAICRTAAEEMIAANQQWRIDPRYIITICDALTAAIGAGGQAVAWQYTAVIDDDGTERRERRIATNPDFIADLDPVAREVVPLYAHPVQPGWRDSLLDKLAEHKNFELSWGAHPDDDTEACWQVHRVNGGRNDREWTLIGVGNTPHEALCAALPVAPKGE